MTITKLLLEAGQIESLFVWDSDLLNLGLLRQASDIHNKLRASDSGAVCLIPGKPSYEIGLGSPITWERIEKIQANRSSDTPLLTQENLESVQREARRDSFYIKQAGKTALYSAYTIVSATTRENDPHFYGSIAGYLVAARISMPADQRDRVSAEERRSELKRMVAEIWSVRPAVVVNTVAARQDSLDSFADCFAAVMLLYPER